MDTFFVYLMCMGKMNAEREFLCHLLNTQLNLQLLLALLAGTFMPNQFLMKVEFAAFFFWVSLVTVFVCRTPCILHWGFYYMCFVHEEKLGK